MAFREPTKQGIDFSVSKVIWLQIIKCSKIPERPLTGSGNLFFRMYISKSYSVFFFYLFIVVNYVFIKCLA